MRGKNFKIHGPSGGHWAPEKYFDGPVLPATVKKLTLSLDWVDQGFGNRKGEIFVKLMRPSRNGSDEITEKRFLFGIAEHERTSPKTVITKDPILDMSASGDFYRFMRNAGGGGGHTLTVNNFKAIATLNQ